ncbi:hypothetical protein FACS1894199_13430 [Bacteroidia bacterium]|nr:hypothetical protein FACS1894199_13430 [Bacteroidia bacterium]
MRKIVYKVAPMGAWMRVCAVALLIGIATGCDKGSDLGGKIGEPEPKPEPPDPPFLSAQSPIPVTSPDLLIAYKDAEHINGIYFVGSIANQIIAYDDVRFYDGKGLTMEYSMSNTTEQLISSTITSSVEAGINVNETVKASVGVEIDMFLAKVKEQVEVSATIGTSLKEFESYQTTESVKTTITSSKKATYPFADRPEGYYIYGSFAFVDYYVEVSIDPATKKVVARTVYHGIYSPVPIYALQYSETNPFAGRGLLIADDKKLNVDFDVDVDKVISEANKNTDKQTAITPTIAGHPVSASYGQNAAATALSVTVTATDGGTLSYQWYANTSNSTTGASKVGTNSASYTPATSEVGTLYYYVMVTNTKNGSTSTIESSVATVDIIATSSSVHVYDGDAIRSDYNDGDKHTLERPVGLNIDALTSLDYTTINIAMSIEIRAQDTGDGRNIWLDIDGSRVWIAENVNVNKTSWYKLNKTASVPIGYFNNSSVFRFGFWTKDYKFLGIGNDAIWFFNTADVTFTAVK